MKTEAEFWNAVRRGEPNECWEWTRAKEPRGYGYVWWRGADHKAHRIAYALSHPGEDITGKLICHQCDNPPCCNPGHLFAGTSLDNVRDRFAKGRFIGEESPHHRFTVTDVKSIRHAHDVLGITPTVLAGEYGSSLGAIRHIVKRETWKHVPENSLAAILTQAKGELEEKEDLGERGAT